MRPLGPARTPGTGGATDSLIPRRAEALAALGERFPEETRALVTAMAPALAGSTLQRWFNGLINFINHLSGVMKSEERGHTTSTLHPGSLWLQVTANDLTIYCGQQGARMSALERSEHDHQVQERGDQGSNALRPQPHLSWCKLRPHFLWRVGARLGPQEGAAWRLLARWVQRGFPLHYHGPARSSAPASLVLLRKATSVVDSGAKGRLQAKITALLEEGGPMFGPFKHPPFPTGIASPVLAVNKKDGSVRPVYHCSYPHDHHQPSRTRSLNGGIAKDAFWFPTYDSVASWILQWYLTSWASAGQGTAPVRPDYVVFKLDFESAFRQVPIQPRDWRLLMLYDAATGAYLLETCAAFGTRISADLWLRVANVWKLCLHASGFTTVMVYVDDLAVICPATDLHRLLRLVATLEQELGSRVHWGKVFPDGGCTPRATVLGVVVDVQRRVLELDPTKARHRASQARRLLASELWAVSEVEKLVGAFNFFATALPTGRLLLGPLYALMGSGKDVVKVGPQHAARLALVAWQDMLGRALATQLQQPMFFPQPEVVWLATDASDSGLGGCSPFGAWSAPVAGLESESINVRELAALWASVTQVWPDQLRGKLVHAFVDNETARAWAGRPPSRATQDRSWAQVVRLQHSLALHLQELHCTMVVHRVPTEENDLADQLSREPTTPIDEHVAAAWAASVAARVQEDDQQQQAAAWLAERAHDTPILWWSSKPTALGALAPAFVRGLVASVDQPSTDRFARRPLLHSLLQRHPVPRRQHRLVDADSARAWWRSLSGLPAPRQ